MPKTYIILLRGVNVSGKNKIKMQQLTKSLENAGFTGIQTYIQSGNIVLKSELTDKLEVSRIVEGTITKDFGFDVPAIAIDPEMMGEILTNNPFKAGSDEKSLYVTFLWQKPEADLTKQIESNDYEGEEWTVFHDKIILLSMPNGYGKAKLNNGFFEKKLRMKATTRNWQTVNTLYLMATTESQTQ